MRPLDRLARFVGGDPSHERVWYRTEDGRAYYQFGIDLQPDDTYHIHILNQPSYNGRPTDSHSTHRILNDGTPYVCIRPEQAPTRFAHAKNWAKQWAEKTENYRKYGQNFT